MLENPQSFVVSTECRKIAGQNGFRRVLGENAGWAAFGSTTAQSTIYIASEGPNGPWFLAIDRTDIIEELALPLAKLDGPGRAIYAFDSLGAFYIVMPRVYQLAASLPDAPLREFQAKTAALPKTTEAERLVVQRVGQDVFRSSLMDYWQSQCPLTGITDPALLRASHIIPWTECSSDAERLDVYNGLLLSALWDAAFDRGLVTFGDDGQPEFSPALSEAALAELRFKSPIALNDKHRAHLAWHRANLFQKRGQRD